MCKHIKHGFSHLRDGKMWYWDSHGKNPHMGPYTWEPYPMEISAKLQDNRDLYGKQKIGIKIDGKSYDIDFKEELQYVQGITSTMSNMLL